MSGNYNFDVQAINIEPPVLIDETSATEYYIGTSINDRNMGRPYWKIKRIWKIGNVWKSGFPNGNQDFKFIWDDRYTYVYS